MSVSIEYLLAGAEYLSRRHYYSDEEISRIFQQINLFCQYTLNHLHLHLKQNENHVLFISLYHDPANPSHRQLFYNAICSKPMLITVCNIV